MFYNNEEEIGFYSFKISKKNIESDSDDEEESFLE